MSKYLSKSDLITSLANSLDLSDTEAEKGLNQIVSLIVEKLTAYQAITLMGFGAPINIKQTSRRSRSLSDPANNLLETKRKLSTIINQSKPGHEKRKLQRRNFILDIEVTDQESGQALGDLGDITAEGLMVVSDDPIAEDSLFSLLIQLPEEADESLEITFDAKSIRCQQTIHENIYITGFKIETLDESNRDKIEHFISEYAV